MKKHFSKKSQLLIVRLSFFFSFLLQFFYIPSLPGKYFSDSMRILNYINGSTTIYLDSSYMFTVNFFKFINIFKFSTFASWAYFITFIFSLILIFLLNKYQKLTLFDLFFIYCTFGLLNIYIFRIGKDIIQFIIWMIVYFVVEKNYSEKRVYVLMLIIFSLEGLFFRTYYIALPFVFIFLVKILNNEKKINFSKIILTIILSIFIALIIAKHFMPSLYYQIINLRYSINADRVDSPDAVTAINDILSNSNSALYIINYFINFIRMLFPFELIMKGSKYILFIVYQLFFDFYLYNSIKRVRLHYEKKNIYYIALLLSYMLIANLYEPDFGSLIRHESALLFIFVPLFFYEKRRRSYNEKDY